MGRYVPVSGARSTQGALAGASAQAAPRYLLRAFIVGLGSAALAVLAVSAFGRESGVQPGPLVWQWSLGLAVGGTAVAAYGILRPDSAEALVAALGGGLAGLGGVGALVDVLQLTDAVLYVWPLPASTAALAIFVLAQVRRRQLEARTAFTVLAAAVATSLVALVLTRLYEAARTQVGEMPAFVAGMGIIIAAALFVVTALEDRFRSK